MASLKSSVCGSLVWKANESPLAVLKPGTETETLSEIVGLNIIKKTDNKIKITISSIRYLFVCSVLYSLVHSFIY